MLVYNTQGSAVPEWTQVAVTVDWVPSQVQACKLWWTFRERLDDTQLVVTDIQVGEAGAFWYSCVGQVLQGHVVQEEVREFGHGHRFFSQVSHGVVAQVQTGHLWQSGYRKGEVWKITSVLLLFLSDLW